MFERPSGPRSGSLDKRLHVHSVFLGLSELDQANYANMTGKELREIVYELERAAALAARQHRIRMEQSH